MKYLEIFETYDNRVASTEKRRLGFVKLTDVIKEYCDGKISQEVGVKTGLKYFQVIRGYAQYYQDREEDGGGGDVMFFRKSKFVEIRFYDKRDRFYALKKCVKEFDNITIEHESEDKQMDIYDLKYSDIDGFIDKIKEVYPQYKVEEDKRNTLRRFDL